MTKLSKSQRDQLIGVAVAAVAAMAALWFFVVSAQEQKLKVIETKCESMTATLKTDGALIRRAQVIGQELTNRLEILQKREADLAPEHAPYDWMVARIPQFLLSHKGVSIPPPSIPEISDKGLLAGFPYKWATFHVKGVGYYRELGKFFADFENAFPYYRIQNVDISAAGLEEEPEKLTCNFDIVTPLVPTGQEAK